MQFATSYEPTETMELGKEALDFWAEAVGRVFPAAIAQLRRDHTGPQLLSQALELLPFGSASPMGPTWLFSCTNRLHRIRFILAYEMASQESYR